MSEYIENLSNSTPKARKDYECMASLFLREWDTADGLTFAEKRAVVQTKNNNWRIKRGETYVHQRNISDGYIYTFRAIPAIHAICARLKAYVD